MEILRINKPQVLYISSMETKEGTNAYYLYCVSPHWDVKWLKEYKRSVKSFDCRLNPERFFLKGGKEMLFLEIE